MADESLPVKKCRKCGGPFTGIRCFPCYYARRKAVGNYAETNAAWRNANPEKVLENQRAYYEKNRERILARVAAKRKENPEILRDRYTQWARANPEKKRESYAAWSAANPEKQQDRNTEYRLNNPERVRIHKANRRARKKANGGTLSAGLVEALFALQRGKCACCGLSLKDGYQLDHIMPLALGGSNTDDNMQLLTPRCNGQKHKKHPIDFMRQRGLLL